MLNDLARSISEELIRIKTHFGDKAISAIVGSSTDKEDLSYAQIKHLPIADTMSCLYDYGLTGEDVISDDPHFHVTNGLDWIGSQLNADLISIEVPDSLIETVFTAQARWALDDGEDLNIPGLARLARISERSVRNASSKKEFAIFSQGQQTLVKNNDARKWLAGRKGFIPTRCSSLHISDILEVKTRAELGSFIKNIREQKHINTKTFAKALGITSNVDKAVEHIENGMEPITFDKAEQISKILDISYSSLIAIFLQIYHPDKVSGILSTMIAKDEARSEE